MRVRFPEGALGDRHERGPGGGGRKGQQDPVRIPPQDQKSPQGAESQRSRSRRQVWPLNPKADTNFPNFHCQFSTLGTLQFVKNFVLLKKMC